MPGVTRRLALLLFAVSLVAAIRGAAWAQTPAPAADDPARFAAEIDAFTQWDSKNATPDHAILFVGSSTIRMWPTHDRFPTLPVINRGFGGSQISDVNFYIDQTTLKYAPDIIVFYAGDNDLNAGKTPERVLQDFRTFVMRVLEAKSGTQIIYLAVKPSLARWSIWPVMQDANARVKADREGREAEGGHQLHYLDLSPQMLGADGTPRPELFIQDGLHMTAAGYDLWTAAVATELVSLRH